MRDNIFLLNEISISFHTEQCHFHRLHHPFFWVGLMRLWINHLSPGKVLHSLWTWPCPTPALSTQVWNVYVSLCPISRTPVCVIILNMWQLESTTTGLEEHWCTVLRAWVAHLLWLWPTLWSTKEWPCGRRITGLKIVDPISALIQASGPSF